MTKPALVTIKNVPLMEAGEDYMLLTGLTTFTADDLAAAVAAQDDPGLRTPVIKIGHGMQPGGVERPTIGRIENLRTENEGMTLVGDLVGVPAWLGEILPSAYPQRSIEGAWDLKTHTGNEHRFALTAVALLGETDPGISTLDDIQALFEGLPELEIAGVNASSGILVQASSRGGDVTRKATVRAAVEVEDVRRSFYENEDMSKALGNWAWIRAVRLDPTDLIVDDDDGHLYRVPYAVGEDDSITFQDPVEVAIEYKDKATAASAGRMVRFASAEESRHGTVAASDREDPEEGHMDPKELRALLGLPEDATDEQVQSRLGQLPPIEDVAGGDDDEDEEEPEPEEIEEEPESDDNPAPPSGEDAEVVTIDRGTLETLQRQAAAGAQARERQRREDRDNLVSAAVKDGKIPPARASHYKAMYDRDPKGTKQFLDSQPKGLIPVEELGDGDDTEIAASAATEYNPAWLTPAERERAAAARQAN